MTEWNRGYVCGKCYLVYDGEMSQNGREPCPACGEPSPHALDTFGCFYWEEDMFRTHGENFFVDNYWWCPLRVNLATEENLKNSPYTRSENLVKPNIPKTKDSSYVI